MSFSFGISKMHQGKWKRPWRLTFQRCRLGFCKNKCSFSRIKMRILVAPSRFANCTQVHRCTARGTMPRVQPAATDGCWPSLERRWAWYGVREKERQRGGEGRPVPSSRTELTERHTEVSRCSAFTWEAEQESLLQPRPFVAHTSSAFAATLKLQRGRWRISQSLVQSRILREWRNPLNSSTISQLHRHAAIWWRVRFTVTNSSREEKRTFMEIDTSFRESKVHLRWLEGIKGIPTEGFAPN